MENQPMTWNISNESNITRPPCRTLVDVAFLASYMVTGVAIFIGNLFTCAVFLSKHQLRRTFMNAFLISLACSDFLMAVLVLPGFTLLCTNCPYLSFSLSRNSRKCRVLDGLKDFVFLATVFNVLAITFDRYQAVLQSLRYHSRINKKTVTLILVLVWLVPWPIAYLKHILVLADPLILKEENSAFIYDNVVVFTCIIAPMVVLLVVNSMLTRAIRGQQAKISIPGNLYLTQQQMEELERKNEKENSKGATETRTRAEENEVGRDSNKDSCANHINKGFQGDDEPDENNESNLQELNNHVIGESREDHVIVPYINPTSAPISRDNMNIIATEINVVNNGFQGDDEQNQNCSNLNKLEDHVTCDVRDAHVTVYVNHLRRKSLDINVCPDTLKAECDSEFKDVIIEECRSKTFYGFSHNFEIQQEDCVCRMQIPSVIEQGKNGKDEAAEKTIKPCPRRKMGCVIQPEKNELFLADGFQTHLQHQFIEEYSTMEKNNSKLDAENTGTKRAIYNQSKEQLLCARRKSENTITTDSLRRDIGRPLRCTRDQNVDYEDARTTQSGSGEDVLQNECSSSFANSEPRFLKSREFSNTKLTSSFPNAAISNPREVNIQSQNEDNEIKCKQDQDHGAEGKKRVNEEKEKYDEGQNPENERGSKKNITFQEHKKTKEKSTDSSLIRKQLRKFSRDRKEKNGTRSCLTVALIFVTCWIPRCLYNFFLLFAVEDIIDMYLLEKFSMLFLFMQSVTNPLVYCFYRKDFRQTAKELIRKMIQFGRENH